MRFVLAHESLRLFSLKLERSQRAAPHCFDWYMFSVCVFCVCLCSLYFCACCSCSCSCVCVGVRLITPNILSSFTPFGWATRGKSQRTYRLSLVLHNQFRSFRAPVLSCRTYASKQSPRRILHLGCSWAVGLCTARLPCAGLCVLLGAC